QICEQCGKSASNLTRILDRLEKKKLLKRRSDPTDRRTTQIFLTPQGETLRSEVTGILDGLSAQFTQGISSSDQQIIKKSLNKIVENIGMLEPEDQSR
ncbi:MAG: MarR family transcriptional regulator, partial [Deltaproteobacteria bacterium]|nr:MarR family transcriptional regulator [Deltaproteobacteria bacterium]